MNPDILSFHNYLKFEKRYSAHTIRSYTDDLTNFFQYLHATYGDEIKLEEIRTVYVRSWLACMKDQGMTSRTINRKMSTLKSFFKFHIKQGRLVNSPMSQVVSPKISQRLPVFVKEQETEQLLDRELFPDDWKGVTDRLTLFLLYHTGVRLSELINLKETSVDFSRKQLKVLGKGNKERILPISDELITELKHYLQEKQKQIDKPDRKYFLITVKGEKLYPAYVYRAVRNYLSKTTTIRKKSPHVMRHTFATHLMNNGADLNAVKELLGHASLAATQIYTHNTIEKLKEVYRKAHPKA